jgi:hypothetical protein
MFDYMQNGRIGIERDIELFSSENLSGKGYSNLYKWKVIVRE